GDDREPVRALREPVVAIVVLPTPPGAPIEVEVRGRLAALIGHEVFPAARMWGGKVVAEAATAIPPTGDRRVSATISKRLCLPSAGERLGIARLDPCNFSLRSIAQRPSRAGRCEKAGREEAEFIPVHLRR